jgi:hypothetical protein
MHGPRGALYDAGMACTASGVDAGRSRDGSGGDGGSGDGVRSGVPRPAARVNQPSEPSREGGVRALREPAVVPDCPVKDRPPAEWPTARHGAEAPPSQDGRGCVGRCNAPSNRGSGPCRARGSILHWLAVQCAAAAEERKRQRRRAQRRGCGGRRGGTHRLSWSSRTPCGSSTHSSKRKTSAAPHVPLLPTDASPYA